MRSSRVTPPPTPEDESYLESILRSDQHRRFFTRPGEGRGVAVMGRPTSRVRLHFRPQCREAATHEFVYWFSRNYATDPETADNALELFRDNGSRFSAWLWDDIEFKVGDALHEGDEATRQAAKRWIPLLLNHVPPSHQRAEPFLLYLLWGRIDPARDPAETLLLLDYLFTPVPSLPMFPLLDGGMRAAEPELRVRPERGLAQWSAQTLLPALGDAQAAQAVAGLVDQKLRIAHAIAASDGDIEGASQKVSFGRAGIEPNPQDRHPDGIDPLIDLARDVLEALLKHHPDLAELWLQAWAASEPHLLRRLAIHGWVERQDKTSDEKIDWLIDNGIVFAPWIRHEALRLLKEALPKHPNQPQPASPAWLSQVPTRQTNPPPRNPSNWTSDTSMSGWHGSPGMPRTHKQRGKHLTQPNRHILAGFPTSISTLWCGLGADSSTVQMRPVRRMCSGRNSCPT